MLAKFIFLMKSIWEAEFMVITNWGLNFLDKNGVIANIIFSFNKVSMAKIIEFVIKGCSYSSIRIKLKKFKYEGWSKLDVRTVITIYYTWFFHKVLKEAISITNISCCQHGMECCVMSWQKVKFLDRFPQFH